MLYAVNVQLDDSLMAVSAPSMLAALDISIMFMAVAKADCTIVPVMKAEHIMPLMKMAIDFDDRDKQAVTDFLFDVDSDPYEHRLADGRRVIDVYEQAQDGITDGGAHMN